MATSPPQHRLPRKSSEISAVEVRVIVGEGEIISEKA